MLEELSRRYIELQALMITPIAPHWADYIWQEVLGKKDTIQNALWPEVPAPVPALSAAREYVRTTSSNITSAEGAQIKRKSKGKATAFDPKKDKKITIFVAQTWPEWQTQYLDLIRTSYPNIDNKVISKHITNKADTKKVMAFVNGLLSTLKNRLDQGEDLNAILDRKLPFNELETLRVMVPGLKHSVQKCVAVEIITLDAGGQAGAVINDDGSKGEQKTDLPPQAASAVPGNPSFAFENVESIPIR